MLNATRPTICPAPVIFLLFLAALSASSAAGAQCSQGSLPPKAGVPVSANESSSNDAVVGPQSSVKTVDAVGNARPVTVLEDTPLRVRSDQPISSRLTKPGESLSFTIDEDVVVDGLLVIPCGATVRGSITDTKKAGVLTGSGQLTLELNSLALGGQSYPLYSYQFKVSGASKTRPTEKKIATGAATGTAAAAAAIVVGSLTRNTHRVPTPEEKAISTGAGTVIGAGVGTAVSAVSPAPIVSIPAESEMIFVLSSPIAVVPVDAKEAARLARGMKPGGPVLYVRDETQ